VLTTVLTHVQLTSSEQLRRRASNCAGLRFPSAAQSRTRLYNALMYSNTAALAYALILNRGWYPISDLSVPQNDLTTALSSGRCPDHTRHATTTSCSEWVVVVVRVLASISNQAASRNHDRCLQAAPCHRTTPPLGAQTRRCNPPLPKKLHRETQAAPRLPLHLFVFPSLRLSRP
jgi:hypothetical protein